MFEKCRFLKFPFVKISCRTAHRLPITDVVMLFLDGDNSINIEAVLSLWSDQMLRCCSSHETQMLFFIRTGCSYTNHN